MEVLYCATATTSSDKQILGQKFWSEICFDPKILWSKKMLTQKHVGRNFFLTQKLFGRKFFLPQKFGSEIFGLILFVCVVFC